MVLVDTRRVSSRRFALVTLGACASLRPLPALAARGAAELDLEYYARSLIGKTAPPTVESVTPIAPRLLDRTVASGLLDALSSALATSLDVSCEEVGRRAAARRPSLSIEFDRLLATGAFGGGYDAAFTAAANQPQASNNQFAFDLSLCALYSQIVDARLPPPALLAFNGRLGTALLDALQVQADRNAAAPKKTFGAVVRGAAWTARGGGLRAQLRRGRLRWGRGAVGRTI